MPGAILTGSAKNLEKPPKGLPVEIMSDLSIGVAGGWPSVKNREAADRTTAAQERSEPKWIGNDALMLWHFRRVLPPKSSKKCPQAYLVHCFCCALPLLRGKPLVQSRIPSVRSAAEAFRFFNPCPNQSQDQELTSSQRPDGFCIAYCPTGA